MEKYISKIAMLLLTGTMTFVGCTSSFDEVNTDPDRPTDVPATNMLAFCERYASDSMFDEWFDLNESSGFAGQISKLMYTEEGYYNFRPNVNNNSWYYCYRVISNLQDVIDKSKKEGNVNMEAVATVFQCQVFQVVTDRWRDVPFTEASSYETIKTPKYDTQETIYPALLEKLKVAADALGTGDDEIGSGDILLGGDLDAWRRYCNSLRLRMAMRISDVASATAKVTVEEILGNPAKYPLVDSNESNVFFTAWGTEYNEPWADYYRNRANEYGVSETLVNKLKSLSDPRLSVYATPASANSQYVGYPNGLKAYATVSGVSKLGTRFMARDNFEGFTPYFRSSETYFEIAEASLKGYNTGTSAEEAYNKAVRLSLEENGIPEAEIVSYLSGSAKYDGTKEQLFTQLWISLFKQGMEAWSSYRRSGYPTENKVAPDSYYPGHNTPPFRYTYPDTELNLNPGNAKPAQAEIVDYFWGKQMWWDTRKGVN